MRFLRLSKKPAVNFVGCFAIAGIAIPLVLIFINFIKEVLLNDYSNEGLFLYSYIFFFPVSMGMGRGPAPEDSLFWFIFAFIFFNSIYYSIMGFLLWFGLSKSRLVLFVFLTAFVSVWAVLFYALT